MDHTLIPFAPHRHDVICGRGGYQAHPGNVFYYRLLEKCVLRSSRHPISQRESNKMVDAVLDMIVERRQGRFVRPDDDEKGFAIVLTRKEAERKIRCDLSSRRYKRNVRIESKKAIALVKKSRVVAPTAATRKTIKNVVEHRGERLVASKVASKTPKVGFVTDDDFDDDTSQPPVAAAPCRPRASLKSNHQVVPKPAPVAVSRPPPPAPIISSSSSSSSSLMRNSILKKRALVVQAAVSSELPSTPSVLLYGSEHDEIHMRRWLNTQKLPQSVGDVLLELGARSVDDVSLLVQSKPKVLQQLTVLDVVKLERAIHGK